ncbi:lipid II flippase MurJ [Polynucleobacter asymbioticus]|uniref:lipid II flippase MurJ n=1 Tax=Polynucleobacter asymbioticus TaxID=576611 RepID=UPI0016705A1A|nr:lipid II flippase MurJ [Polynucleobacter asymbioticus]
MKLQKLSSFHISSLINLVISLVVASLSFYSFTLIAKKFGGSAGSDAYFFLLSIATLFTGMVGALFTTILLPIFLELKNSADQKAASWFFSSIFSWSLIIIFPIGLLTYFYYDAFYAQFSKFNPNQILDNRSVLIYFAPIFIVGVISELFRAVVLALGEFFIAALSALFQPLFIVIALFEYSDQLHEEAIAISLLTSKIITLILFFLVASFKNKLKISINFKKNSSAIKFVKIAFPYWSGNLITNLAIFFVDYLSSGLGPGVLTSISYAQRIFALPTTLLVNPILEIARTKFSESQVKQDKQAFLIYYNKLIEYVIYLTIPIGCFYFLFAEEIVAALFQRGAFNSDSVAISAACLKIFAISIPFVSLFMVNGRACESFQKLKWPSIFGTLGNLLMMFITYIFINKFGYLGIPYARLAIDLIYFFPFGFIALTLFFGSLELIFFIKKIAVGIIASSIAMAIYFISGIGSLFKDSPISLMGFIFYGLIFFIIYIAIIFAIHYLKFFDKYNKSVD